MDPRARRLIKGSLERLGLAPLARRAARAIRAPGVPTVRPSVLRVLAHDIGAHTQGLAYFGGQLYESTGRIGESTLRFVAGDLLATAPRETWPSLDELTTHVYA